MSWPAVRRPGRLPGQRAGRRIQEVRFALNIGGPISVQRGMMVKSTMGAALCALMLVCSPARARPTLTHDQRYAVEHGHVLDYAEQVSDSSLIRGKAIAVIDDVPEAVFHVVLDVGRYKFWVPHVKDSRVTRRTDDRLYAVVETALPWPIRDAWIYSKLVRHDRPGRVFEARWWMLNGTVKQYSGFVRVEPWSEDGRKSFITYTLLAELKTAAPDAVIKKGVMSVVRVFVQKLKLRLKALRRFQKTSKTLGKSEGNGQAKSRRSNDNVSP